MLNLLRAELRRMTLELTRYPAEAIGGTAILIVVFYGFFAGANYIAGTAPGFGERLDSLIVGYVMWTLVLSCLASVAFQLERDMDAGVLQLVFMSSYGLLRVFIVRAVAEMVLAIAVTAGVFLAILLVTGSGLSFRPIALLPILAILLGAFGLAFIAGALAMWLKQARQLINLGQFGLLFLIAAPFETFEGFFGAAQFVLPIVPGVGLLRDVVARGADLSWSAMALAFANGSVYALLGLTAFRLSIGKVRRMGSVGWY